MEEDILILVSLGTVILLLLIVFVVVFIMLHYRKSYQYRSMLKQEILKANLEVREQTLQTISQEIHDNIGQSLSLVKLNLAHILLNDASIEKIHSSKELVSRAINDLRTLSKTLNGEFISNSSLCEVVTYEVQLLNKTGEYNARLKITGEEHSLAPQRQLILYRIIQEVFSNSIKHANGTSLDIDLVYAADSMTVAIKDNGIGFVVDSLQQSRGTGLGNIRYRSKLIGAELTIVSSPGEGTHVQLSLPYKSSLNA